MLDSGSCNSEKVHKRADVSTSRLEVMAPVRHVHRPPLAMTGGVYQILPACNRAILFAGYGEITILFGSCQASGSGQSYPPWRFSESPQPMRC